ncbi:MAG: GGDEF domain-containing protein [Cyanobacteria bacterium P01_A01_bin.114]
MRGLAALTVQTLVTLPQLETAMFSPPPDVAIVQVKSLETLSIFHQIKQHRHLSGIYFILVADQIDRILVADQIDQMSDRHLPPIRKMIEFLEAGADAYLELADDADLDLALLSDRLLQAQVKIGLRRAQAYRELTRTNDWLSAIALVDSLTQLSNRRAFDLELPRQIQNSRQRSLDLCLMILDIDYFKVINDTHGHMIGDEVLRLLAEQLHHNMRFYDTPFRYGGEEFTVILSDTGRDEAEVVGQRLCETIAATSFKVNKGLNLSISVSIGIACLSDGDDLSGRGLLERADQNLLRAKTYGRNQVVITNP